MKLLDENGDPFFGAMFRPIIISLVLDIESFIAELTVSKEDNKPPSAITVILIAAVSAKFKVCGKREDW